ncbi:MAG: beta-L-arabinofuranosidase domain-containing protein [Pseudomonadota bacterium]
MTGLKTADVSRREFVHCAACATAATSVALPGMAIAAGAPVAGGKEAMHEFAYGAVKLTGGPIKQQFDHIHAHYLALDNDRVLKVFRENAGLPAPGPNMGGWYDQDGFVPGLTLGQYISGLARLGAATGDKQCHDKVAALVDGFGKAFVAGSNPYAGPKAQAQWAAYVMDKYVVGMIDAYRLSGVEQAKTLLPIIIEKCRPYISPVSRDRIGKVNPPYDETYVISENLFHVADITGDEKYRQMAIHYLLDKEWFDPLAAGQDVLPEKHAYSHTIALSSGAQAYLHLGNDKYRKALVNAWKYMEPQRFASGGWGPEEQFVHLHQGKLAASLKSSKAHFETPCGAFADLKLARYLVRFTGEPQYGDGLERTLYNTMLATRLPDSDGGYPYYSDYGSAGEKRYYHQKWPCCSGTLVQGVADYVLNVYFHDDNNLMVNMYTPSEVTWIRPGGAVEVVQETGYPSTDTVRLKVRKAGNGRFGMKLRIPAWSKGATLRVNGAAQRVTPGTLATVTRTWKAGDTVELTIPQPLRTLPIDDQNPNLVAVMRGPVMYVGINPWEGVDQQAIPLPGALEPMPNSDVAYRAKVGDRNLVFIPYFNVDTERSATYFKTA